MVTGVSTGYADLDRITAGLQPGDLVFFNTMRQKFSHVGIYLGGGTMVHAPQYGDVVKVSPIRWWKVVGVVRPG